MAIITSDAFQKALIEAGVIRFEDRVRRVVIDATVNEATVMYVERFGDEKLLEVVPALVGVEIRAVGE
jgi:hypothetical protein